MAHVTFLGANEALAALAAAQHHMVYTSYRKPTNVFLHTFHNGLVNRTSRSSSTYKNLPTTVPHNQRMDLLKLNWKKYSVHWIEKGGMNLKMGKKCKKYYLSTSGNTI